MASYTNGTNGASPKITLYTNHSCPYAARAHIALAELKLPYEEVIIDLDRPREPWYLEINPRGLVPTIKYSNGVINDEIITESAVVTQFLADSRPSHLLPASNSSPEAPLIRARTNFFIDTWSSKLGSLLFSIMMSTNDEDKEAKSKQLVAAVEKEIEPLLKDAAPFFGGSKELTLAEVNTAPFVLRFYAYAKGGLFPALVKEGLDKLPNFTKWAEAVQEQQSVTQLWNEDVVVEKTKAKLESLKAKK